MPLPLVTAETADSLAQASKKDNHYYMVILKKLQTTNPVVYQYLDYTIALITQKYSPEFAAEVGSVVGMTIGLLESQAEADEMQRQFEAPSDEED